MLEPVEKQSISDEVFYKMLDMIAEGQWKCGDMIPSENELKNIFMVSRDTVRQAVNRLRALGVLKSRQGKGTYVEKIDMGFYLNLLVPTVYLGEDDGTGILEFLKAIQIESVRIVCERAKDQEIARLEEYLAKMRAADDYEEFFQHDMGYHQYLADLTGNVLFIESADMVGKLLHIYLRDIAAFNGSGRSIEQHQECYDAMRDRDTERAMRIMAEHYDMLSSRLKDWLAKNKV